MRQKSRAFWIVLALLVVSAFVIVPSQTASAAPPRADKAGYSIFTVFSPDPTKSTDTASFAPDVPAIYAWVLIASTGGAPDKQFQVDVQFVTPLGQTADSQWYSGDTGNLTSISQESVQAGNLTAKNIARKQVTIAGTQYASATGQWTVNFLVGGKTQSVGNFTLAGASDVAADDAKSAAQQALEKQGYTVSVFDTTTWDDGTIAALVRMPMTSRNLYAGETTKQIVDGFGALRKGFPDAGMLFCSLEYSDRYYVVYNIKTDDWDAYTKTQDFNTLLGAVKFGVWDVQAGDYVTDSKAFVNKNFGAGTYQPPPSAPGPKQGTVGSVRVQVSPNSLPSDGSSTATVTVTVSDKNNKPAANSAVTFKISGTGAGTIAPQSVTTDSKGQAVAKFTAGTKPGSVTITAAVGSTSGTVVVTLEGGQPTPTDNAADNVRTFLTGEGFTVTDVRYDAANSGALVVIDLGGKFDINDLPLAIIDGTAALRDNYSNAKSLIVVVPYQQTYFLVFPAAASDVDQLLSAGKAAGSDKAKVKTAIQNFLTRVYNSAYVADFKTGERVGTFKDFANKNFGGG